MVNRLNPGLTVTDSTDQATTHPNLHAYLSADVISIAENVVDHGADPTGSADSATAIAAAITALGTNGGTVYFPPGTYSIGSQIDVPSAVTIKGSGRYSTKLQHTSGHTGFMFRTVAGSPGTNFYAQNFGQQFRHFELRDRNSANTPTLQTSGRSETHHGILVENSDWGIIEDVSFRDLQGKAIDLSNVVREWYVNDSITHNCGYGAGGFPAIRLASSTGDASNTIYFRGNRVYFSNGLGVEIDGAQDGIRLIVFTDCQFEGGGNGTGVNFGNTWPYSLVRIGLVQTVDFKGCNFANPGTGYWGVDLDGSATSNIDHCSFNSCHFNGNAIGGGIRVNRVDGISVVDTLFVGSTSAQADFYVETVAGIIHVGDGTTYSSYPTAGSPTGHMRGHYTTTLWDVRDRVYDFEGGGVKPAYSSGQPSANLNVGAAVPNGLFAYDTANHLYWMRQNSIWVPLAGQVVVRDGEAGFFGSTAENTMLSYTCPANLLHTVGGIEIVAWGYFGGATASTATFRFKIGGSTVIQDVTPSMTGGSNYPWMVTIHVRNVGSQSVNRTVMNVNINSSGTATTGRGDIGTDETTSNGILQADTTANFGSTVALALTIQLSAARDNIRNCSFARIVS